ncbi:MAG TPA: TldD/PmbA family protein [Anaerolineae bacterium]|nr:TldD/PmbA family protein [Anaerolineae bacterium]
MGEATMLGEKKTKEIANTILARSAADQTEVVILAGDHHLTRFANSTIHQNVAETDTEVRIRVVVGSRVGVATTNNLAETALTEALDSALSIARLQPENPDFKSLPGPQPITGVTAFSEDTARCAPEQRAGGAGAICLMARDKGVVASGALTTAILEVAVANTLGTFAYHPTTYADINTVIMSDTSAGYASALALDVNDLDFEAIGLEAVEKCLHSQNPRSLEPGEYTVILEPYAVQDFVQMMAYTGLSAVALQEGRSFMSGKIGQQIVDSHISIWDDGLSPDGMPWPFDFEGVPKQRVDLIEGGVARGVVYDSYRAGKEQGKESTGHALPAPNTFGPFPLNTFFAPGDAAIEEMIASTDLGLYVTRFHYTRPAEPTKVVITGMTRDGTFLIKDGEIAHPVRNLRFTQSYLEALNHVDMIGKEPRLLLGMGDIARDSVPALKLSKFMFTGATEF